MPTFVALMRGINVGSARKLPMADLRDLCVKLGLERPQTYIQSGNLLVDAKGGGAGLRRLLEKECAARFGFTVDVVMRSAAEWASHVAANPFADDARASSKMLHLYWRVIRLGLALQRRWCSGRKPGSGLVWLEGRSGSTMGLTASPARSSARFSSIRLAARRRPAATGTAC